MPVATIDSFSGDYRFLSNFWPCKVRMPDGILYPSVEHAYQASKTDDRRLRFRVSRLSTAGEAKRFGRSLSLAPGGTTTRVDVMRTALRVKFSNPTLLAMLISTRPANLVEGNHWGDTFWGVCGGVGQNQLGRLLMEIRDGG